MSAPEDIPDAPIARKRTGPSKALIAIATVVVLILGAMAAVRYGVLVPQVRTMIEARTDGLKLGRIGRLKLEGLSGDIWRDLRVRRVTISDEKGVWIEANNVHLSWRYSQLLQRSFDADLIEAETVRVIRRPVLGPKGKDRGLPVSIHIGAAKTQLQLEPAFSYQRGVYDVGLELDLVRNGGQSGKLRAESVLHPGDHLNLDFALGKVGSVRVLADAVEARGGALAGAIGLPANLPFKVDIRARGTASQGEFTARTTSGDTAPLNAQGAWTPEGGQAGGQLILAASSLTAPYAARFGRELRFGLAGRKTGEGDFALDAKVLSEALTVHAWGPGDLGKFKLSPKGVRVEARAPSLSRITGGPDLGATQVSGLLTGTSKAWRFAGTGAVSNADLGDYGLARISGPVEIAADKGVYSVKARLAGAGGHGAGFAAAILGGAPTLILQGERLANGQLLVRELDMVGRGLKVEASGGRSLLGAVKLKAKVQVSNLAAARPGASGAATLDVTASQARTDAPWRVSLDARGDRFALGIQEVDRLLGGKPSLKIQADWAAGRLAISKANLDGAAVKASTAGVMEASGALAFKTDWSASGPFRAGPVEITGRAKGTGAVDGTLSEPRLDLVADLEQIDLPRLPLRDGHLTLTFQRQTDGSSGAVALNAASTFGPAKARSNFRFPTGGVDLTDLAVDAGGVKAQGALSLRNGNASAANLTLDIGPGAFLDAGKISGVARITDAGSGPQAVLNLRAEGARLPGSPIAVRSARISADGPLAHLPFAAEAKGASGQGPWTIGGRGVLNDSAPGYLLTFDGKATLGDRDLHTVESAAFRFGGAEQSARLRLAGSGGGRLDFDGSLKGEAAEVRARVAEMGLNLFNADFDGRIDGTLVLQGRGDRLEGALDARLSDARGRGTPANQGIDGTLKAKLTEGTLTLDAATSNEQGLKANANLILPAESSARPFRVAIARKKPMRGRFFAEGEVRPLWELAIGGERSLSGIVHTEGTISGILADPQASGQFSVESGRFDDGASGLTLRDVALKAGFNEDSVNITGAEGSDGRGGQLSGQGRISLQPDGVSSFRLDLKGFRLIDNETATATATGQATINRAADGKVKLSGDLTIDRADVAADPPVPSGVVAMDVREINRPDDLPATIPGAVKKGEGWALDVKLKAPRRVFLRGRGLDLELSLDAHVGGTTANTNLTGTARVVRGGYDFAGKRFEFDDTSVVYLSSKPENIRLQLDATREDPTLTVTVQIRGTAARPEITLTSSPSLPNDEILAKVLFERSASQLSPVEAAQLASALSSLTGGGGLDVIGNLRSFAGLDRLAFGGGQESGVTVSGGKYLTDDVYLELTGGGRDGPSAQVEWRIRKNLSILSRVAGEAGNRIAVRWRKNY